MHLLVTGSARFRRSEKNDFFNDDGCRKKFVYNHYDLLNIYYGLLIILRGISNVILCDSIDAVTVLWKYLLMKLYIFATSDGIYIYIYIYIFADFRNHGLIYFNEILREKMVLIEFGELSFFSRVSMPNLIYFYNKSHQLQNQGGSSNML